MSRRNNKKQSEVDFLNLLVTIVTLLSLILGAALIVRESCKIVGTGLELWSLNSSIQRYNESAIKTDEWTKECEQHFEKRRQIYESEDIVIRTFSTLPTIPKAIALLLSVCMIFFTPFAIFTQLVRSFCKWRRKRIKRMKRMQEQCQSSKMSKARQFS